MKKMKKRNKKILSGLLVIASMLCLSGCCISHKWQDAACTAPKTCTECGKTEGEPLGHTWADATCAAPKTCSVCGETEGEALAHTWTDATCAAPKTCSVCGQTEGASLGHTWTAANYQEAKTCSVCAETEGEPLTAAFEEHGLTINAEEGVTYDFRTVCQDNRSKETVGHAVFSDYQIVEEDAGSGLEKKDGYEWRTVHIEVTFDDENAWDYGMYLYWGAEDYYDIEGWEDSETENENNSDGAKTNYYTINYHGMEYDCEVSFTQKFQTWDPVERSCIWEADYYAHVPADYDGIVIGLYNGKNEPEGYLYNYTDEGSLFFRMD